MADQEVPEPDAVEQAVPVVGETDFLEPSLGPEVPEADALEQATVERLDDDEEQR